VAGLTGSSPEPVPRHDGAVEPDDPVRDGDAAASAGDALPEDLDVTAYVGPYLFPDTSRRRTAGILYAIVAGACLVGSAVSGNTGLLFGGLLLALIAVYQGVAAWPQQIDQTGALAIASREVGFPVGHASGQLTWRGLRSRPAWRILVYSAEDPPSTRGLVELDAVDGHVLGSYAEPNPEDWSQYGLGESPGQSA
jgi:hypothetical protein